MPRLNQDQRNQAVGMLNAGQTVRPVSRAFGCTRRTITLLIRRFRQTGSVQDRVRTTARDDRYIALTHLRQRYIPATITARRYGVKDYPTHQHGFQTLREHSLSISYCTQNLNKCRLK